MKQTDQTDAPMALPADAEAALDAASRRASDLMNEAAHGLGLAVQAHWSPLTIALTANVLAEMAGGLYARAAWAAASAGADKAAVQDLIQSAFLKGKEQAFDTMMAARLAAHEGTRQ